jgi:GNAT superfamily N-acetyltransferase
MADPPLVRPARAMDTGDVLRIYVDSWNQGFGDLMPHKEWTDAAFERWKTDLAAPPPMRWWVAERRGKVVGFAGIGPCRDPEDPTLGELDTIAIDPPAWRTGIGEALMCEAHRWLEADGYREAALWTLSAYPRGAGFYVAMGWRRTEHLRDEGRQMRYARSWA